MATESNKAIGRENPAVRHLWRLQEMAKEHNLPAVIQEEITLIHKLIEDRVNYGEKMTSPLSGEMSNIFKETHEHPWQKVFEESKTSYRVSPFMISGKTEASFLKAVVGMSQAKCVLELGLFTGFGALAIAESLPNDGEVYSCETEEYIKQLTRTLLDKSPHGTKITIKGPALETLKEFADSGKKFDLIFLDSDKSGYIPCYKFIMDNDILAPNGTIVADNAFAYGRTYCQEGFEDGQSIADFNQMVYDDDRVEQVLLPIKDGVNIIRRKRST